MKRLRILSVIFVCGLGLQALAQDVVELPQEELPKESVLPVFDRSMSVKNRNVVTENRWEVNGLYGMALSEPIYNVNQFGLSGYYNTSEENSYGLIFTKNAAGLSQYANQLHSQFGLDFARAPAPQQSLLFDWNAKLFYGKMSITKNTVFNTSLYSTVAGGMNQYQNKSYPAIAAGLGQKFYFNKNLALRFDLRLFIGNAPVPFLQGRLRDGTQPGSTNGQVDPTPAYGEFSDRLTYTTVLDVGLSYLL